MLHSGEWLAKKYASFAQPRGNQTLDTTLTTLAARLQGTSISEDGSSGSTPTALPPLADRRAAILTLKGLARDHPVQVGDKALEAILASLVRDAREDDECARAVVEACLTLCEVGGASTSQSGQATSSAKGKDTAPPHVAKHIDQFLATPGPLHALLPLLSPRRSFYTRFSSLQLLGTLLRIRPERVQEHVLTSPGGCGAILECLSEGSGSSAEIVRNEALLLLPRLVNSNADIQKLVAFEGAFEKLIDVVALEGRIEGGVVVQDALEALVALLRYNVSNQNYFRETLSVPLLAPLLFYPPPPPQDNLQAVQEHEHQLEAFAFQQWYPSMSPAEPEVGNTTAGAAPRDEQKVNNAGLVLTVAGLLVEGQGDSKRMNQNALLQCGFTQCVIELSLASTAPATLRSQALQVLSALLYANRSNQDALNTLEVMPILQLPSEPDANPQEPNYTRLPPRAAIVELVGAAIHGISFAQSSADALAFRASAMDCFDSFVNDNLDARLNVIRSMAAQGQSEEDASALTAGTHILNNVSQFPDDALKSGSGQTLDPHRTLISTMMFAQLIRGSETAKTLARGLLLGPSGDVETLLEGTDGNTTRDEDDERNSLIQVLVGNLTMALREHGEAARRERGVNATSKAQMHGGRGSPADWTRIQVGYLTLLITWLWESPGSVVEFLRESSNLQVLIQPVSQGGNLVDPIVSGLCAVVLGVAYEFGPASDQAREDAGFVTRMTIHPILHTRIGPDQFAARLHRLRDDTRFKNTGPDVLETLASNAQSPAAAQANGPQPATMPEEAESGLWFDWAFVDFLKTNYVQVQKSILVDPESSTASIAGQSTELVDAQRQLEHARELHAKSLRDVEALQYRITELDQLASSERARLSQALDAAQKETQDLRAQLTALQQANEASSREREGVATAATAATNAQVSTLQASLAALDAQHKEEGSRRQAAEGQLAGLQSELMSINHALREARSAQARAEQEARDATARAEAAAANAAAPAASTSQRDTLLPADDGEKSREELEKELEDLLVLLDELSTKRRNDKKRMRQAHLSVSDDEDDDVDEEDEPVVLSDAPVEVDAPAAVDDLHDDNVVVELEDAQKLFADDPHPSIHSGSFPNFN